MNDIESVTKSYQSETEALREIIRNRDATIKALQNHSLCIRESFKSVIQAMIEELTDEDLRHHMAKMIDQIDETAVAKVGHE